MTQYSFLLESNAYMQESVLSDLWGNIKHKVKKAKNTIVKGYKRGKEMDDALDSAIPAIKAVRTGTEILAPAITAKKDGWKDGLALAAAIQGTKHATRAGTGMLDRAMEARKLKKARRERDARTLPPLKK